MTSLLTFGFLLGIRHALEADHIATVASLACDQTHSKRQMIQQGLAWGLGHSITLFGVGGVVLWMDTLVPEKLALALEMTVGAMMIVVGIGVIRRGLQSHFHVHAHRHASGEIHIHGHSHTKEQIEHHGDIHAHRHKHRELLPIRALLMGLIHGAAGSAALLLLFFAKIDSVVNGLLYICLFSVGSMVGMLLFSIAISVPLTLSAKRLTQFHRKIQYAVGGITAGIGLTLLIAGL